MIMTSSPANGVEPATFIFGLAPRCRQRRHAEGQANRLVCSPRSRSTGKAIEGTGTSVPAGSNAGRSVSGEYTRTSQPAFASR